MKLDWQVERALQRLSPKHREQLALDPRSTIQVELGLEVRELGVSIGRETGGACDGMSFLEDGVLLFRPSPTSKRENFTLCHELGHWLIEQDTRLIDWLSDQQDSAAVLETLCDRVAKSLLLPADLVGEYVTNPVRAQNVVDMTDDSAASLPVCGIAVAERLPGLGAVVIIDRADNSISFASVRPDDDRGWPTVYPWPGELVATGHSILDLVAGGSMTRRSFWTNRWGNRADYFIDAVASERRICAVFSAADLWKTETLPSLVEHDFGTRLISSFRCCGVEQDVRGYPCSRCGRGFCRKCGNCRCTSIADFEGKCVECFSITPAHLLREGRCELCA